MYYVIGADGKMNGPLSVADVHQLLAEGRASKYSRVKREGDEAWQPLSAIPELAPPPQPPPAPVVPAHTPPPPESIASEYLRRDVSLDAGRCVSRGWALVRDNLLVLIGAAAVVWSVLLALSFVPVAGWVAGMVVNSPLLGGLYYVYLRRIRGERAGIEDVLAGFRTAFQPLLVAGLLCGQRRGSRQSTGGLAAIGPRLQSALLNQILQILASYLCNTIRCAVY